MKKILFALCLSLIIFGSHAQSTTDKVLDNVGSGMSAVHEDTKSAVSVLHEDASKIIETAYTDSKSVIGTIYDDANQIVKYLAPKVEAGLVTLAQTLKTTVAEVYEAMIRKQIAVAISYLCYGLLGLFFIYLSYRIMKLPDSKLLKVNTFGGTMDWKLQWIIGLIVTSVTSILLMGAFIVNFQEMVIGFYAPKYGAIQDIVKIVNSLLQ